MRKFLCMIGLHKWEIIPRQSSQNIGAEIILMFSIFGYIRNYKCEYCGKIK